MAVHLCWKQFSVQAMKKLDDIAHGSKYSTLFLFLGCQYGCL